jgi:hypothetical protein
MFFRSSLFGVLFIAGIFPSFAAPKMLALAYPEMTRIISSDHGINPCIGNEEAAPAVVVVPGILGSKLERKIDGSWVEIWGPHAWGFDKNANKYLPYDESVPDEDIRASILTKFSGANVHGGFVNKLRPALLNDMDSPLIFAYDWRQDISKSAQKLHEMLTGEWKNGLCNRSVIFVSHSMGGLVTSWWYHSYFAKSNVYRKQGFQLEKIYLLGVPHTGAPYTVEAIAKGYQLLKGIVPKFLGVSAWIDKNWVSRTLNIAGPTFPSLYQLMPPPDALGGTITYKQPGVPNPVPIEFLNPAAWEMFNWPKYAPIAWKRELYYRKLPTLIKKALNFHKTMKGFGAIPDAHYFYGMGKNTVVGVKMKLKRDGKIDDVASIKSMDGDGTVPDVIAVNPYRPDSRTKSDFEGSIWNQNFKHMELPDSVVFLTTLLKRRGDTKTANIVKTVSKTTTRILNDPTIYEDMKSKGRFVPVPVEVLADPKLRIDPKVIAVTGLNKRLLEGAPTSESMISIDVERIYKLARKEGELPENLRAQVIPPIFSGT